MNSVVWVVFMIACIGNSHAGLLPVNPGGIGGLFKGPNSETIIRGPDGSEIISEQIGGAVQTEPRLETIVVPDYPEDQIAVSSVTVSPAETISISNSIEVASPTPTAIISETPGVNLQISPLPAAPIPQTIAIQASAPVAPVSTLVTTAEEPHIIETELVDAPDVEPNQSSDLEGPSGSISVRGSSSIISGPASTTISEPVRRIPIATIPIAAPLPAVPSTVLIPPSPTVELVDAPDVEPNQSSDLEGPSGSISVRGSSSIVSGPSSTTISEPVRRIPTATVAIAAPSPAVPSTVLIPPPPTGNIAAIDGVPPNIASEVQSFFTLNANSVPPNVQIPLNSPTYNLQQPSYPTLNTDLVPPPVPNSQITLGSNSGASIADASLVSPQTQSISSTPIPPESLPPNAIDLGQTIVSTTQRSTVVPSSADIDASRINLGQSNTQQTIGLPIGQSESISSTVSPIDGQNVVSSSPAAVSLSNIQTSLVSQQNGDISLSQDRPGITTANISPTSTLSGPGVIFSPNGLPGRIYSQDQSIVTNQIISNSPTPTTVDNGNLIGATRTPIIDVENNIPSDSWLHVEPNHIIPTASSSPNGGNAGPISTILDTVLVQPTDPRNREVIEFGGKQLENVGNIVPVIHQPVLVAGGFTQFHNIPTASVSQLASRNVNTNDYNRYERQTRNKN